MPSHHFQDLQAELTRIRHRHRIGRVAGVQAGQIHVTGLCAHARIGDRLRILRRDGQPIEGEVLRLSADDLTMLPEADESGVALLDIVILLGPVHLATNDDWLGRVVDPFGRPLDNRPLFGGAVTRSILSDPPSPVSRRGLGQRLETGMAVMNTFLPVVRGQRVGLFAGSGVGKSSLLAHLARHMQADVVVIALIGERGREVRDFVQKVLGPKGMERAVVVAATADMSAPVRRRCALAAMSVAEYFRDQGLHVLFLADSITRFAEAHREIASAAGELPSLRGFPPSTVPMVTGLCERAGPGEESSGDITAILTVLVAGSDQDEPVADILRGVLDGHIVLDRAIAERGRYPAVDLLRSVSRSLPTAATDAENLVIAEARQLLGAYQKSEMMIRAGLYVDGSDPLLDRAISIWAELDQFLAEVERQDCAHSFAKLTLILRRAKPLHLPVSSGAGKATGLSGAFPRRPQSPGPLPSGPLQ